MAESPRVGSSMSPKAQRACTLPYPDKFEQAAKYFNQYASVNPSLSTDAKLLLYGLAQQAVNGPCTQQKPWAWNAIEVAKWQAWNHLKDMDKMEAMRLFVKTLEEDEPDWYAQQLKKQSEPAAPEAAASGEAGPALVREGSQAGVTGIQVDGMWTTPWVAAEKHPHPRFEHGACMLGNCLFVIGGNCAGGRYLSDVWQLNVDTLQWTCATGSYSAAEPDTDGCAPAVLPPCAGMVALPHRGRILVVGGHTKDKNPATPLVVRALDPARGTWSVLPCSGDAPSARGGHGAAIIGDKLYLAGGESPQRRLLAGVHVLDLRTMVWSQLEKNGDPLVGGPSPRSAMVVTAYQDRYLMLFGGGDRAHCHQDLWLLDTTLGQWERMDIEGAVPTARAGCAATLLGNRWFVVGGGNNKAGCPDMWALDLTATGLGALSWEKVADYDPSSALAAEGLSVSASSAHGVLLAFGGYNGTYHNAVSVFKPVARSVGAGSAEVDHLSQPLAATTKTTEHEAGAGQSLPRQQSSGHEEANGVSPTQQPDEAAAGAAQEAAGARDAANRELALMRRMLATAQSQKDGAEAETQAAKDSLADERDRAMQLEAQVSELQSQLELMKELQQQVDTYKAQLANMEKKGGGLWGYISGA